MVLIAPHWQAQAWFPALLELVVEDSLRLPRLQNLLTDPSGTNQSREVIWKVPGDGTLQQGYHSSLATQMALLP